MDTLLSSLEEVQLPKILPPILLMAFNRPDLLKEVLKGIEKQILMPPTIIAYIDGPRVGETPERKAKIQECKDLLENFKSVQIQIRARETNWGVTKNTLDAITTILNEYESVIFLEDDVIPGPYYYKTMTLLLEAYKLFKNIFSIQPFRTSRHSDKEIDNLGRDFCVFNFFFCWGFGTWSDRWSGIPRQIDQIKLGSLKTVFKIPTYPSMLGVHKFIFRNFYNNPKLDDWSYRVLLICLFNKKVHICPRLSLIRNIGYAHPEAVLTKQDWPTVNKYYSEIELKTLPVSLDLIPAMYRPLSKMDAIKFFSRLIITKIIIFPALKKSIKKLKKAVHL